MLAGETAPGGDRQRSVPPLQFLRGVLTPSHHPNVRPTATT